MAWIWILWSFVLFSYEASAGILIPLDAGAMRIVTAEIPYFLSKPGISEDEVWASIDFRAESKDFVNLGFLDEVLWLKIELQNPGDETVQLAVDFPFSRWSSWTLTQARREGGSSVLPRGVEAKKLLTHRRPTIVFTLPPKEKLSWLLRVESVYGLQWTARQLGEHIVQREHANDRFHMGLYLGIVGFAIFFFLAVSLESRLRLAIDFVLFLCAVYVLLIPSILGYEGVIFGFSDWVRDRATFFLVWPALATTYRLQRNIEERSRLPFLAKAQLSLLGGLAFVSLVGLSLWQPWLILTLLGGSVVFGLLILIESLLSLRGGSGRSWFFLLGWLLLGSAFLLYARGHGLVSTAQGGIFSHHLSFALLALFSLGCFSLALADAYRTLQRDILREQTQRQSWEQAMRGAHEVQETFIQGNCETDWYEIRPGYYPCEATGGDWLGYRWDVNHQELYVAVADVDGHGFSAALVAGTIHGAFYSEALLAESLEGQREGWLRKMVQHLHTLVHITEHSTLRSVTMVGCCLDFRAGVLHYINVGHVPVLLLRDGKVQTLFAIGSPLGLTDEPVLGEKSLPLREGDRLLLLTDGILAERSRAETAIKLKDVAACLRGDESLAENQRRVEELIREIAEQKKDDCTYLLLQVKQLQIPRSLKEVR